MLHACKVRLQRHSVWWRQPNTASPQPRTNALPVACLQILLILAVLQLHPAAANVSDSDALLAFKAAVGSTGATGSWSVGTAWHLPLLPVLDSTWISALNHVTPDAATVANVFGAGYLPAPVNSCTEQA
jgi:hypothetical protein